MIPIPERSGNSGGVGGTYGVGLELLEHLRDRRVELRVGAVDHQRRVVDHLDVGIDAVTLDAPGAVLLVEGEVGRRVIAAVDQRRSAADPDQPAPGARADQLAEPGLAEPAGKVVAARAGEAVDQHALRAVVRVGRPDQSSPSRSDQ